MKFTTKVLLLTNAFSASVAFAPPRPHSSTTTTRSQYQFKPTTPTQPTKSTTKLTLIPDPSTLESSSIQTSVDIVSTFGALALLGSVGFGVASGAKDDDWDYEYTPGNEEAKLKYGNNADLALMEVSPKEVAEDIVKGEITEPEVTEAQQSFFGKVKDRLTTTATPDKEEAPAKQSPPPPPKKETKAAAPAPPATPVVTAQVAKATKTSDKVLKATEVAKDEVKKKGVQETKEKMSSKSAVADSTPEPEVEEEEVNEVEEVKVEEKGTKRKLVKGVTLIVAAGAVAVARNVVKAWLGRGML